MTRGDVISCASLGAPPGDAAPPACEPLQAQSEGTDDEEEETLAPIISPQLDAQAPAYIPACRPHTLSLFNPLDYCTATLQCDLGTCTVGHIRQFALSEFPFLHTPGVQFELLLNGSPLPSDLSVTAAECGIPPGGVVVILAACSLAPLTPLQTSPGMSVVQPPVLAQQLQMMQQMQQMQLPAAAMNSPAAVQGQGAGAEPAGALPGPSEFISQAMNADGARRLVGQLKSMPDGAQQVQQLLPALLPRLSQLAAHSHAAKVLAAVARVAQPAQAAEMLGVLCGSLLDVAESNAGSDVLVALLETTPPQDVRSPTTGRPKIVDAIAGSIVPICTSVNGRKVLQEALSRLPDTEQGPVYDAICQNILAIATDQCGCITVQRLCDATRNVYYRTQLQAQLLDGAVHLITDPFGNYAVQHAVKDNPMCSQLIAKVVTGRIREFAVNKFSSNVIEKVLQTGPDDVRAPIVSEVTLKHNLQALMQDAYGNYVVQSCVDYAPPALLPALREAVMPLVSRSPYGYRIETKLQRRIRHDRKGPRSGLSTESAAGSSFRSTGTGRRGSGSSSHARQSPPRTLSSSQLSSSQMSSSQLSQLSAVPSPVAGAPGPFVQVPVYVPGAQLSLPQQLARGQWVADPTMATAAAVSAQAP
eukprot:TRINITY_DN12371_c0_g3_i1.p2 TRINITY_DN12371_c0_g3~~TRINITY_DN12371_c0_g3_i1.p2  ORF type:complete len:673 (+),score=221.73 TRINITY_DN12371_c0_g3_i1:89-2020(+)